MICQYCHQSFTELVSLSDIFYLRRIQTPSLCKTCEEKFILYDKSNTCFGCGKKSLHKICRECQLWKDRYPGYDFHHEALYEYNEAMHDWFQNFKFKGDYSLKCTFSKEIDFFFNDKKDYVIIPVPISTETLKTRGFNQVEAMLQAAEISYYDCLTKKNGIQSQSLLRKKQRMSSPQSFNLSNKNGKKLKNKKVILVDDVYTTGRTMFHCAELLLKFKPKKIRSFSLAR